MPPRLHASVRAEIDRLRVAGRTQQEVAEILCVSLSSVARADARRRGKTSRGQAASSRAAPRPLPPGHPRLRCTGCGGLLTVDRCLVCWRRATAGDRRCDPRG